MSDKKIIDLLLKLKELAERGEGGEKKNAERMLQLLMQKNGITWDDLQSEEKTEHKIYLNDDQVQFFYQVAASVLGDVDIYVIKGDRSKAKPRFITCTSAEFIEIESKFEFYWAKLQEDIKTFTSAFVYKNRLYKKPTESDNDREITDEERARLFKVSVMMQGLDRHQFHKQLNPSK